MFEILACTPPPHTSVATRSHDCCFCRCSSLAFGTFLSHTLRSVTNRAPNPNHNVWVDSHPRQASKQASERARERARERGSERGSEQTKRQTGRQTGTRRDRRQRETLQIDRHTYQATKQVPNKQTTKTNEQIKQYLQQGSFQSCHLVGTYLGTESERVRPDLR